MTDQTQAAGSAAQQTTQDAGSAGGTATSAPAGGAPDVATLMARLEKLEAEKAKLINESVERKKRAKEEADKAAALAEEQGQYRQALESYKKRVADLEESSGAAERWRAHEARELERINTIRAGLPDAAQRALDAVNDVDGKRAVLEALQAAQPAQQQQERAKVPPGGTPGASPVDWATIARSNDLTAIREARAKDPDGWAALTSSGRTQRPQTFIERQRAALAARKQSR